MALVVAPAPHNPWHMDSSSDDFFGCWLKNLAKGSPAHDICVEIHHNATVKLGCSELGGECGLFSLDISDGIALGGGTGWALSMEKRAGMKFVRPVAPQSKAIAALATPLALGTDLHTPNRHMSISEALTVAGTLDMQRVDARCVANLPLTKSSPKTTLVKEDDVKCAVKRICTEIAITHVALNAGHGLCTVLGRQFFALMPMIPDKGQHTNVVRGVDRDRGAMIFEGCRNLIYVRPATCHGHAPSMLSLHVHHTTTTQHNCVCTAPSKDFTVCVAR
jgi:hypothetical protein